MASSPPRRPNIIAKLGADPTRSPGGYKPVLYVTNQPRGYKDSESPEYAYGIDSAEKLIQAFEDMQRRRKP
jgi:hypothetical protein